MTRFLGERRTWKAVFARFGTKSGGTGPEPTVLLRNVADAETGELAADHLWMNCGVGFSKPGLEEGDEIAFDARARTYIAGYQGRDWGRAIDSPIRIQLGLERPTKIRKTNAG